jgi:NADPH-dependent 2,4-dienoyl-CoA reductase/sulfur reductase-like enzyme
LSKKLWTDPDFTFDQVWLRTVEQTGADLVTGVSVESIDPAAHRILAGGNTIGYRRLLLATGGEPAKLEIPDDDRIIYFRTVNDYRRLRKFAGDQHVIGVVGGGYIGTELAAALAQNDTHVIMAFPEDKLYGTKFPKHLAERLTTMYADHGVDLRPGTTITGGSTTASGISLTTGNSDAIRADAAVIGLGVQPRIDLAQRAGLKTDNGVVVDEYLTTSDPDILAAGDIASYPDQILGRQRVEHVDNANNMGSQVGRNLAGAHEPYDHTPYFYSVMFGNRYEAVGTLDASLDMVEDWADDQQSGVVYYLDDHGIVAGVLLWNNSGRTDEARRVLAKSRAGELSRDRLPGTIPSF